MYRGVGSDTFYGAHVCFSGSCSLQVLFLAAFQFLLQSLFTLFMNGINLRASPICEGPKLTLNVNKVLE